MVKLRMRDLYPGCLIQVRCPSPYSHVPEGVVFTLYSVPPRNRLRFNVEDSYFGMWQENVSNFELVGGPW